MTTEELRASWKREEDCAFIKGWVFSHLRGRYEEEDCLPWDYEAIVRSVLRDGMKPDLVFLDPPRAGSDERFLGSLLRCAPPRVVYVSCEPETLARDLAVLVKGGYRVEKIQPVDMFPWTRHVETVCCLYRQKKDFVSVPYIPKDDGYLK